MLCKNQKGQAVTKAQRQLIEKTIAFAGYAAVTFFGGLILWGVWRVISGSMTVNRFFSGMFDLDDAALIIWPLFVFAIFCFWVRAFLRAGDA